MKSVAKALSRLRRSLTCVTCCLFLLVAACKTKEPDAFLLTIATWEPLGTKAGQPLPDRLRELAQPIEGQCGKVFIPRVKICRIGFEPAAESCVEVKVKIPGAGNKSNVNLLRRRIRAALDEFTIDDRFIGGTRDPKDFSGAYVTFLEGQPPNTAIVHMKREAFHVTAGDKEEVLPSAAALVAYLQKQFCDSVLPITIVVGAPLERQDEPPSTSTQTDTAISAGDGDSTGIVETHEPSTPAPEEPRIDAPPVAADDVLPERPVDRSAVPCDQRRVEVAPGVYAPKNMCPPGYTGPDANCKCWPAAEQ
ncbi:MAG TPA: hypothetical protein VE974_20005 [Thermoanaerobaculia bacterium]|nr:hypothetical protein [Thermoanaerobaculia bacterium]